MSRQQSFWVWSAVVAVLAAGAWFATSEGEAQDEPAGPKNVAPATLLPAGAVLYVQCDGREGHEQAWKKTAAHEALYESGLMEVVGKLVDVVVNQIKAQAGPAGGQQELALLADLYERLLRDGTSIAIAVNDQAGPPLPYGVVVLHGAAELEPRIAAALKKAAAGDIDFEQRQIRGRKVTAGTLPDAPAEFGWWVEGEHLVVAFGVNAVEAATAIAAGDRPNITSTDLYKRTQKPLSEGVEVVTAGWFNFPVLRDMFGQMPLPLPPRPDQEEGQQTTVNDVLKILGLHNLGPVIAQSGFRGRAAWWEMRVDAPAPRTGLLAFDDQPTMTLDDLPPLPEKLDGFIAFSVDWSQSYDDLIKLIRDASQLAPPDAAAQVEGLLANLEPIAGFDPEKELFDSLGQVMVGYSDSRQAPFGIGSVLAVQVKDEESLQGVLDHIAGMVRQQTRPNEFQVGRLEKNGREIVTLEIGGGFFNPSYTVADGWFVIGLIPQSVEAFYLRLDGKLPKSDPAKLYADVLADMPEEFTSISVVDPRKGVRGLVGLAPVFFPMVKAALQQAGMRDQNAARVAAAIDVSLADFPPAEVVARPLFPNVSLCTVDENGFRCLHRTSLPTIPLLGDGGGSGVAVAAIGAALLLPAVQQARMAARRTQSKNNLKQLGLAMHNHHDVFKHFPIGTHPNEDLKPEKRLSWIADILPFIEQNALHNEIDFDKAWDADANEPVVETVIPTLLNPALPQRQVEGGAPTHYVGIAGVGKDAATLPVNNPKAGVFGFERKTRIRDITDGTSNTMMISEATGESAGPWAAGGKSTIRSLTKKPYINGPDGIGSPFPGGCQVLFADGSVRFISENIDPETFEGLATISGGEVIAID